MHIGSTTIPIEIGMLGYMDRFDCGCITAGRRDLNIGKIINNLEFIEIGYNNTRYYNFGQDMSHGDKSSFIGWVK